MYTYITHVSLYKQINENQRSDNAVHQMNCFLNYIFIDFEK